MYKLRLFKRLFDSKISFCVIFLCTFFYLFFTVGLCKDVAEYKSVITIMEESNFKYIGKSTTLYDNTYYSDIGYIRVENSKGEYVSSDVIMVSNDVNYYGNYLTKFKGENIDDSVLDYGECSVSYDLLKKYDFKIGDVIFLDDIYSCKIKYVFEEYYGIKKISFENNGLIVLGYDEEMLDAAFDFKMITFGDESNLYDGDIVVKEEIIATYESLIIRNGIVFVILVVLGGVLIDLFFKKRNCLDYIGLKRVNYNTFINKFISALQIIAMYLIVYFIPVLYCVYMSINNYKYYFMFVILGISFLINVIKSNIIMRFMVRRFKCE